MADDKGSVSGFYRHFKGNYYQVLALARHSETLEDMVVYRALYGEGGVWVRPLSMFLATVERDGKRFARFEPIKQEMLSQEAMGYL